MFVVSIALIVLKLAGAIGCSWTVLFALIGVAWVARWVWVGIQIGGIVAAVRRLPVRRTTRSRQRSRRRTRARQRLF